MHARQASGRGYSALGTERLLYAGLVCHLGVIADGAPLVPPTAYGRDGDTLYLHGSSANGAFAAASGRDVCVTVTHLDGIVCARSVFSHSVNFRSAVVRGVARLVPDEDEWWQARRRPALPVIITRLPAAARYAPGP